MGQVSACLRNVQGGHAHWCPGCQQIHRLPDSWTFNGNVDRPTFSPSFRHSGKLSVFEDGRWTGEWVRDVEGKPVPFVCHYILTNGVLNFCSDSTHALAGQNVPLPPLPSGYRDGE